MFQKARRSESGSYSHNSANKYQRRHVSDQCRNGTDEASHQPVFVTDYSHFLATE
jgi:hypothetical protein